MASKTVTPPTVPTIRPKSRNTPPTTNPTTASRRVPPPVVVDNRRLSSHIFGEAYLMWRCADCGEMGPLSAFPTACTCGAGREALYYWVED